MTGHEPRAVLGAVIGPEACRVLLAEFGPMITGLAKALARSSDERDRATAREITACLAQMREVRRWAAARQQLAGRAAAEVPSRGTAEPAFVPESASSVAVPPDSGARVDCLSTGEVAGQLKVSESFTRRLYRDQVLPATRGRHGEWRVTQSAVDDYLDTRRAR
jgi:excisionase family DNA binding protein